MAPLWLGILQGLTEFLPVSSSGHVFLLREWWHLALPSGTLEVLLHAGTLVATVVGVWPDWRRLVGGLRAGTPAARRHLAWLGLATVPAALVGGIGGSALLSWMFRPPVVAVGFLVTAALLWTTPDPAWGRRDVADLTAVDAVAIGLAQAAALVPGLSRSGATIVAARWRGIRADAAARLSFQLAAPVTAGAVVLNARDLVAVAPPFLLGAATAAATGLLALKWAIRAVGNGRGWRYLGAYVAGLAALTWLSG
jgi:undecaprenyl-diphosphatase